MTGIKNVANIDNTELKNEILNGGKVVVFSYTLSYLTKTVEQNSDIYLIKANESALKYHWHYTLLSTVTGWWGLRGPINTIKSIFSNFKGGLDITEDVMLALNKQAS